MNTAKEIGFDEELAEHLANSAKFSIHRVRSDLGWRWIALNQAHLQQSICENHLRVVFYFRSYNHVCYFVLYKITILHIIIYRADCMQIDMTKKAVDAVNKIAGLHLVIEKESLLIGSHEIGINIIERISNQNINAIIYQIKCGKHDSPPVSAFISYIIPFSI